MTVTTAISTSTCLRIPVISGIAGLSDAVRDKLRTAVGPASELFRTSRLELVDLPAPLPPSDSDEYNTSIWPLNHEQLTLLKNATVLLGDAHRCAPLLLTPSPTTIKLPKPFEQDTMLIFQRLQWMQATFAGVDAFQKLLQNQMHQELPTFSVTRAGGIMTTAMAQYVFGWIVALERKLLDAKSYQANKDWNKAAFEYRYFPDLTVGILGFGDIGQEIGRLLKTAGFQVVGFKRTVSPGSESESPCAHRVTDDLDHVLQQSDFLVSVLPSTAATRGLLTEHNLALCSQKQPVLINVGRGDLVSEATLVAALDNKWLSRAVLDVFAVEPLPPSSALWTHPLVHITPHVSANSFAQDVASVFVQNLDLHLANKPLRFRVDWTKGY